MSPASGVRDGAVGANPAGGTTTVGTPAAARMTCAAAWGPGTAARRAKTRASETARFTTGL
ncbi:hypothetical protein EPO15_18505 [bacterium]|nr:MAG: hypothetical protein EPO15_18505 [bacterium]